MKKLKSAVIGFGNMGKRHARIYSSMPDIELVGIAEIRKEILLECKSLFQCNVCSDFKDLISFAKPDLVSICVPTVLHHKIGKECISQKVHCLIEKPLASEIEDADDLISSARQNQVVLLTGHTERFNPAVIKVKEIIESGKLGKVISIIARRLGPFPPQIKDVDVAVDLAIHDIDIMNYLLNRIPDSITVVRQGGLLKNRSDSVSFFLRYADIVAFIQANWITPIKIRKLNVTGDKGYLEMDYLTQKIDIYQSQISKLVPEVSFQDFIYKFSSPEITKITLPSEEPLLKEIEYFIEHVKKHEQIDNSFAVDALRIALKNEN